MLYDFLCWLCKESWTCVSTKRFDYLSCVVKRIVESRKSRNISPRDVSMRQITVDWRKLSRQNHMRCRSLVLVAKISSPHALQYDLNHADYVLYVKQPCRGGTIDSTVLECKEGIFVLELLWTDVILFLAQDDPINEYLTCVVRKDLRALMYTCAPSNKVLHFPKQPQQNSRARV